MWTENDLVLNTVQCENFALYKVPSGRTLSEVVSVVHLEAKGYKTICFNQFSVTLAKSSLIIGITQLTRLIERSFGSQRTNIAII